MELTRPKIESRDPIFFTGTRSRSRVSGNDRLFPRGSEFGPNPEIPASPVIQLRPRPGTYLVSLCLHKQVSDTIVNGWPLFECNFNVFADVILPYSSHCIDMTPNHEPINGATGMWLSCFATCDWLRALLHLHCDVMVPTSTTKTWWSCRSLGVNLPCLRKKICHQKTM